MDLSLKNLEIELLEQTDDMIYFIWTKTGDSCRVWRDDEIIYSGTKNSYRDEGLLKGELYTYTIERLDSQGEPAERIKMHTSTENHAEDCTNCLEQIAMTTIVSKSKIALAWGPIEGVEEFEIYRDGELIEAVSKNQYTDRSINKDEKYVYWIRGKRPERKSEKNFSEEKFVLARLFGLFNFKSSQEEAAMEEFWMTKKIGRIEDLLHKGVKTEPQEYSPKWNFQYTTFLPDEFIKNPNLLSLNRYFSGDNRDFDPACTRYRTQVNFSVQVMEDEMVIDYEKDVGTSIAYDWRKKFRKADVASADGIELEKFDENDRKTTYRLTHSVGNPLTPSPNIDYQISASFYRNGHYDIVGIHDQSPNHEVCLKTEDSSEWEQIHEAESKGLAWMSETIASQYWRISNFT